MYKTAQNYDFMTYMYGSGYVNLYESFTFISCTLIPADIMMTYMYMYMYVNQEPV